MRRMFHAFLLSSLLLGPRAEAEPPVLVARYLIDEAALAGVQDTAGLVAALRETARVDVRMPLDEPLRVALRGALTGPGEPAHLLLSSLGVAVVGGASAEGVSWAEAVRESHAPAFPPDTDRWAEYETEGWDEAAAWGALTEFLDRGLVRLGAGFGPDASGHVGLAVVAVHAEEAELGLPGPDWSDYLDCCAGRFEGTLLQLAPDLFHQSAVAAGASPPSDLRHRLNKVVLRLEPAGGALPAAPAAEPLGEKLQELAGYACSHLNRPIGRASVSTGGASEEMDAVAIHAEGQLILAFGRAAEAGPGRCIALYTPGPAAPGEYPLVGLARALDQPAEASPVFTGAHLAEGYRRPPSPATGGRVTLEALSPRVRGTFRLETAGPDAPSPITGSFEAASPD